MRKQWGKVCWEELSFTDSKEKVGLRAAGGVGAQDEGAVQKPSHPSLGVRLQDRASLPWRISSDVYSR